MSHKQNLEDYYRREIEYLHRRGEAFANAYPNLMPFFQEAGRKDPHVERILEGTAFLSAKIQQALDQSQAHLAMELLKLFWPQILSPIPSMALMEFSLRETTSSPQILKQGTLLETSALDTKSTGAKQIKYSVRSDLVVNPLEITDVRTERDERGWHLQIDFQTTGGASLKKIDFSKPIRLHAWDPDEYTMFTAYDDFKFKTGLGEQPCDLFVNRDGDFFRIGEVRLNFPDPLLLDPVIPIPRQVFPGFRMLQEFLLLPSYFLFGELDGLERLNQETGRGFRVRIPFLRKEMPAHEWSRKSLKLHCAPVANLYEDKCRTIITKLRERRFKMQIGEMSPSGEYASIHSIKQVILKDLDDPVEWELSPFDLFLDTGELSDVDDEGLMPCYAFEYESSGDIHQGRDVYIYLRNIPKSRLFHRFSIHSRALWVDRDINEFLREIRIVLGAPETMTCRNVFPPTPYIPSIDPARWRWTLVELMALNHQSVDTVKGLKRLLSILSAGMKRSVQVYQDSLVDVALETQRFFVDRLPVNGQVFVFEVKDALYRQCRGRMLAFFDILHSLLSHYISINSLVALKLIQLDSDRRMLEYWRPLAGNRRLL